MPATTFSIFNFKWVWQTQFLSHTSQILKNYVFFIDVQMILVPFFDTSNQKSLILKKKDFDLQIQAILCWFLAIYCIRLPKLKMKISPVQITDF